MAVQSQKITYTATPEQIESMHASFDAALDDATKDFGKEYPLIINGEELTGRPLFDVTSPSNDDLVLGKFQRGTTSDVDDAIATAKAAYPAWAKRPWEERVAIIRNVANTIRERKFHLAAVMIRECGKSRTEAIGEVEEGADLLDEYAGQIEQHKGFDLKMGSLDPREKNISVLRPYGVWAILAPFNFPNALAAGPISGALVSGNTVV
ncbi:MAG: aldehyde dehydrogenase family protein, partial [Thermomicrobiales bacterium]